MLPDNSEKHKLNVISDMSHYRRIGKSMHVVIPKFIRETLDWEDGDTLILHAASNSILIFPVADVHRVGHFTHGQDTGSVQ